MRFAVGKPDAQSFQSAARKVGNGRCGWDDFITQLFSVMSAVMVVRRFTMRYSVLLRITVVPSFKTMDIL
jgi:hypothetical protein